MKKYYLTLTDGSCLRIEVNWNTQVNFFETTGIDITDIPKMVEEGRLQPQHLRAMAFACAREGERLDGRELTLSEVDFGGLVNMMVMAEFVNAFREMFASEETGKKKEPGKPPTFLTRVKNRMSRST